MADGPKKLPLARPVIRSIIGLNCAMFSPYWCKVAFPQAAAWFNIPGHEILELLLLSVLVFGSIAATVRWVRTGNIEWRLVVAAKKYAVGAITLDEYGFAVEANHRKVAANPDILSISNRSPFRPRLTADRTGCRFFPNGAICRGCQHTGGSGGPSPSRLMPQCRSIDIAG